MDETVIASLLAKVGVQVDASGLEGLMGKLELFKKVVKGIIIYELLHKLYELGERFAALGENLEASAIQTGLSTDKLQSLQYAAEQNALSADDLTLALSRLGRQLFAAQRGGKAAVDAFARLGIDENQLKNFKSLDEALYAVQDGIKNLKTQQEKLATSQLLLGRGGFRFLKFFQAGSEETKALERRAKQVGAIVARANVEALAQFEDADRSFKVVIRDFMANVTGEFIPILTVILRSLETGWGKIQAPVMRGIHVIAVATKVLFYTAIELFGILGEVARRTLYGGEGIGGFLNALLKIGQALNGVLYGLYKFIFQTLWRATEKSGYKKQLLRLLDGVIKLLNNFGRVAYDVVTGFLGLFGAKAPSLDNPLTNLITFLMSILADLLEIINMVIDGINRLFNKGGGYDLVKKMFQSGTKENKGFLETLMGAVTGPSPMTASDFMGAGPGMGTSLMGFGQMNLGDSLNQGLMGPPAPPPMTQTQQSGVKVSSSVKVYMQGNATPEAVAAAVARKQRQELPRLLNNTRRDIESPQRW